MNGFQWGTSSTYSHHFDSILAYYGYGFRFFSIDREYIFIVFEQYDTFLSYLAGYGKVFWWGEWPIRAISCHIGAEYKSEDIAHLFIYYFFFYFSWFQFFEKRLGKEIMVVSIWAVFGHSISPSTKFHIQSVESSAIGVVHSTPIGYYSAVKTPFFAQNVLQ